MPRMGMGKWAFCAFETPRAVLYIGLFRLCSLGTGELEGPPLENSLIHTVKRQTT
jgi:hypothetical protein